MCPLCSRVIPPAQADRHHLVPKSKGGRQTEFLHRVCHRQVHALLTESELAGQYIRKDGESRPRTTAEGPLTGERGDVRLPAGCAASAVAEPLPGSLGARHRQLAVACEDRGGGIASRLSLVLHASACIPKRTIATGTTRKAAVAVVCRDAANVRFAAVAVGGGQPSNLRSRPYCGQSGQQTAPAQATGVRCTADVPGVGTGPEAQGPVE